MKISIVEIKAIKLFGVAYLRTLIVTEFIYLILTWRSSLTNCSRSLLLMK